MKVVRLENLEDCFDGSFIKEFELDEMLSESLVKKLGQGCFFEYFADFPRPFFRIEKKDFYQIKGVVASNKIKVFFYRNCSSKCVADLVSVLENL